LLCAILDTACAQKLINGEVEFDEYGRLVPHQQRWPIGPSPVARQGQRANGHAYSILTMICNTAVKDRSARTQSVRLRSAIHPKVRKSQESLPQSSCTVSPQAVADPALRRFKAWCCWRVWCECVSVMSRTAPLVGALIPCRFGTCDSDRLDLPCLTLNTVCHNVIHDHPPVTPRHCHVPVRAARPLPLGGILPCSATGILQRHQPPWAVAPAATSG